MQESMLQLLISMTKRRKIYIQGRDSICHQGIINGIQAEDGSGTGFNLNLVTDTNTHNIYLKRPVGSGLTSDDPIREERAAWNPGS